MKLEYVSDETLPGFGSFDFDFSALDPLKDAVILSLFCWARANADEVDPDQPRFGWWGGNIGSKLFITQRAKITANLLPRIKAACEDSLNWLIVDGVAKNITVDVFQDSKNLGVVSIAVKITKPQGDQETFRFTDIWKSLSVLKA